MGIFGPDVCTLCAAPGPTLENARQCLGWWRHCSPAHRIFTSPVSYLLRPAVGKLLVMVKCVRVYQAAFRMLF
ncbi:hypothetical protein T07_9834 [Trichinella nelsoni]|uniref:Uncharacterized protein n=1 Tax=Trichinella nelsoni TaxID=6336 RepID=A0A0V0RHU0_9BILA|nr:hypothetical protein T07_9834 [Trichinella nelsoni]